MLGRYCWRMDSAHIHDLLIASVFGLVFVIVLMRVSAGWAESQLPGLEDFAWGQPPPLLYSHHWTVTTISLQYNPTVHEHHGSKHYHYFTFLWLSHFKFSKLYQFVDHTIMTHSLIHVIYVIYFASLQQFIVLRCRVFCFTDLGLSREPSGLFLGCDLDNETLTTVSKTIFPPTYTQHRFCSCFWAKTGKKQNSGI